MSSQQPARRSTNIRNRGGGALRLSFIIAFVVAASACGPRTITAIMNAHGADVTLRVRDGSGLVNAVAAPQSPDVPPGVQGSIAVWNPNDDLRALRVTFVGGRCPESVALELVPGAQAQLLVNVGTDRCDGEKAYHYVLELRLEADLPAEHVTVIDVTPYPTPH